MQVSFIEAGGVETRYYHAGEGRPVYLLHGVGVGADSWICNIDELAACGCRIIAPDLLGSGFTPPGPYQGGPPIPYLVNHVRSIAAANGHDRIALVGSSLGALVAVHLALEYPALVERLVVVNSGSLLGRDWELMRRGIANSQRNGRQAFQNPTLQSCRSRMANIFIDVGTVPDAMLLMQLTAYAMPWALASYDHRMSGLLRDLDGDGTFVVGDKLADLDLPVLVIWGRDDPRGDFRMAMDDFGRLKNAMVEVFDHCGHMPHVEQPARFNRVVGEFLAPG